MGEIVNPPRPYVRAPDYFGPERRRKQDAHFAGPWRRATDPERDQSSEA